MKELCKTWLHTTVNRHLVEEGTRDRKTIDCTDLEQAVKNLEVGDNCPLINRYESKSGGIHIERKWSVILLCKNEYQHNDTSHTKGSTFNRHSQQRTERQKEQMRKNETAGI